MKIAKTASKESGETSSLKAETVSTPPTSTDTEEVALASETELTQEQQAEVDKLQARDAEVRTHEAAHLAAAGPYAQGSASYTYETGPDGRRYAVGGEVSIDASPISGDPQATIAKMQTIRNAALAPASPSSQDYKVAAAASQQEAKARMELARETSDAATGNSGATGTEQGTGVASGNQESGSVASFMENRNAGDSSSPLNAAKSTESSANPANAKPGLPVNPGIESNGISPLTTSVAGSDLTKSLADGASAAAPRQTSAADLYLANSRLAMGDQTQTRRFGIFA